MSHYTNRCLVCGCPEIDHVPIRYVILARIKHAILARWR